MEINLDGKQTIFEKFLVPEDVYIGVIKSISEIKKIKGFGDKEVEKFVINVELSDKKTVPAFLTAKIIKSNNPQYSNSKLYDLLEKSKDLEEFRHYWSTIKNTPESEQLNGLVIGWLRTKLIDREVKITTKTTQNMAGEKYSIIEKLIRFNDVVEEG